jgi:hypothetical protein
LAGQPVDARGDLADRCLELVDLVGHAACGVDQKQHVEVYRFLRPQIGPGQVKGDLVGLTPDQPRFPPGIVFLGHYLKGCDLVRNAQGFWEKENLAGSVRAPAEDRLIPDVHGNIRVEQRIPSLIVNADDVTLAHVSVVHRRAGVAQAVEQVGVPIGVVVHLAGTQRALILDGHRRRVRSGGRHWGIRSGHRGWSLSRGQNLLFQHNLLAGLGHGAPIVARPAILPIPVKPAAVPRGIGGSRMGA